MATSTNQGFLDSIGFNNFNESAAFQQRRNQRGERNSAFQTGVGAGVGASGLFGAIGGLISGKSAAEGGSGEGGRSFKEFIRDFRETSARAKDTVVAQEMGMAGGVEELRAKRKTFSEIRAATSSIPDDGSIKSRIELAKKVAQIARRNGDLGTLDKAMRQVTDLEREGAELEKLEGIVSDAERDRTIEREVGFEARHIDDKEGTRGRAVRINEGPDAGKYKLYRPGQEPIVVEGGELITPQTSAQASAGKLRADETLMGLAKANGATPGKIGQLRGQATSMEQNARIVSNIASNLSSLADPQAALDLSGRAAIAADKTVSFVESITGLFSFGGPNASDHVTYNGRRVSTEKQRIEFIKAGRDGGIERFAKENGFADARSMLPEHLQDNAVAAEQYWANIMELAYLDARLMEPSNRGLSDNDIQNALKRIGADTANPVSFALRQREVIMTNLLPALENLGGDFSNFGSEIYTRQQIADVVYGPETRNRVRAALFATVDQLDEFIARGRRGAGDSSGAGTQPKPTGNVLRDLSEADLDAQIAELEAAGQL